MSDISNILKEIKNTSKKIEVYVPSIANESNISPITLAQQSKIIETVSGNVALANNPILALLEFNSIMFSILKANIVDYQPVYNTVDRVNFIIALKQHIDPVVTDDGVSFDLSKMLERNKSIEYKVAPAEVASGEVTFNLVTPSLEVDDRINKLLLRRHTNSSQIKSLLSDVYIYEAVKFIDSIAVGDSTATITKDKAGVDALRGIDMSLLKPVFEYIGNVRQTEEAYTKSVLGDDTLDLTPDLFIS